MTKSAKVLLGIATIFPFLYMIFFFVFVFSLAFSPRRFDNFDPVSLESQLSTIILLHILAGLLLTGLTIFYIVNVFRNNRVSQDKKVLWAVVIFFGNVLAMPVYWYLYIWPEGPVSLPAWQDPRRMNGPYGSQWQNNMPPQQPGTRYDPPPPPPDWRQGGT